MSNFFNREQATTRKGTGQWQYKSSRSGKEFSIRKVRKPKTNLWKLNIQEAVLECARQGMVPDTPVPVDPHVCDSRPKPKFSKEEMVTMFQTRVGMSALN
jgi:hypothetical protein